mmetsp:Transcript_48326/g.103229  ORF Transcript_48326/g.103229 Transcript_48326/m.103229 type:complete len:710 (-) Transcript_48326:211-2340(-)
MRPALSLRVAALVSTSCFATLGGDSVRVEFFTMNSNMQDMGDVLSKVTDHPNISTADVLVTCQQEAVSSFWDAMKVNRALRRQFELVAHGEHWGATSAEECNAQILSVFVRRQSGGIVLGRVEQSERGDLVVGLKQVCGRYNRVMRTGQYKAPASWYARGRKELLSTKTVFHTASRTGKGGISVAMTLPATPERDEVHVSVTCGHFDSQSEGTRNDQIEAALEEAEDHAHSDLGQVYCPHFDPTSDDLRQHAGVCGIRRKKPLDGMILFGDLNYRLHPIAGPDGKVLPPNDIALKVSQWWNRDELRVLDPLFHDHYSSQSGVTVPLVHPHHVDGKVFVNFTCNTPYNRYPPTYKRYYGPACIAQGTLERHLQNDEVKEALALGHRWTAAITRVVFEGTAKDSSNMKSIYKAAAKYISKHGEGTGMYSMDADCRVAPYDGLNLFGKPSADPGESCLFGVDSRDEGYHCIGRSSMMSGKHGWCFTSADKQRWGACDPGCSLAWAQQTQCGGAGCACSGSERAPGVSDASECQRRCIFTAGCQHAVWSDVSQRCFLHTGECDFAQAVVGTRVYSKPTQLRHLDEMGQEDLQQLREIVDLAAVPVDEVQMTGREMEAVLRPLAIFLTVACHTKFKSKWPLKKKKLMQLGWLDRVCWRQNLQSNLEIGHMSDVGFTDEYHSDHAGVLIGLTFQKRPTGVGGRRDLLLPSDDVIV